MTRLAILTEDQMERFDDERETFIPCVELNQDIVQFIFSNWEKFEKSFEYPFIKEIEKLKKINGREFVKAKCKKLEEAIIKHREQFPDEPLEGELELWKHVDELIGKDIIKTPEKEIIEKIGVNSPHALQDVNAGGKVVEEKSLQELTMPEVFKALKNAPLPSDIFPEGLEVGRLTYREWYYGLRGKALEKF